MQFFSKILYLFVLQFCLAANLHGQKIDSIEYFIDVDPGIGQGNIITGLPDTNNLVNYSFSVDLTNYMSGHHTLFTRTFSDTLTSIAKATQFFKLNPAITTIHKLEYFWNNDPGFGEGINIPVTPGNNLAEINLSLNAAILNDGPNHLFLRSQDNNGNWSIVGFRMFIKLPFSVLPNLVAYEYFLDHDPGIGQGTSITFTPVDNVSNSLFSVDISSISIGFHKLFVRSKNANNVWSIANTTSFVKLDLINSNKITKMEYFLDQDPGLGNGNEVMFAPQVNANDIAFGFSTNSLSNGIHHLFVRSKDSTGIWTITNKFAFVKFESTLVDVIKTEYYIDTDPGFGNGVSIAVTPSQNLQNINFPIDISNLSSGFHQIYIRSLNGNGHWSLTNKMLLFKEEINSSDIVKLEYFIDVDPGLGNGISIPITANQNISNFNATIEIDNLSFGFHHLYLRSKSLTGQWSLTNKYLIVREPVAGNITNLEYYINTDPGIGNGISIAISPMQTINDLAFVVDLSNLAMGFNHLFVRSKDDWSITNHLLIIREPYLNPDNIVKIEYFVDADPGPSNGVNVAFTHSTNLVDLNIPINVSSYPAGIHTLFLRSKDSLGLWSLTAVHQFTADSPLPLTWLSFDVAKIEEKYGKLDWQTASEVNVSHFLVERSGNASDYEILEKVLPKNNIKNEYTATDKSPFSSINYYRIRQVDYDGSESYSEIRQLDFQKNTLQVAIINNPSSRPSVQGNEDFDLMVFGIDGKSVAAHRSFANEIKTIHQLAPGQYLFVVSQRGRIVETHKVVVTR